MRLGKEQVAVQQLDTAIRVLLHGGDVVSVHTLACAAAEVFRDMLKAKGGESWRDAIIATYPGIEKQIHDTLARAQNFLKHADRDPDDELDFDETTNDETIVVATLEYGELLRIGAPSGRTKTTTPMSVFQLWYFAKDPRVLLVSPDDLGARIVAQANLLFPDLADVPRVEQRPAGLKCVDGARRSSPGDTRLRSGGDARSTARRRVSYGPWSRYRAAPRRSQGRWCHGMPHSPNERDPPRRPTTPPVSPR